MGYTHYYQLDVESISKKVQGEIRDILSKHNKLVQREFNDNSEALVSNNLISFNGKGDDGHETFVLRPEEWAFCKTARKPYDIVVCEILLLLKHHYRDGFELNSDGFLVHEGLLDGTWNQAIENLENKLDLKLIVTFDDETDEMNLESALRDLDDE